jgi:choice-of-anchor B domain-containing protein
MTRLFKPLFVLFILFAFYACSSDNGDNTNNNNSAIVQCINGMAGQYPCNGFDLVAHIPLNELGGTKGNDSWGWTDPETGKEYVLMGIDTSLVFVDISNPEVPIVTGTLPTATESSPWRDIKVYNNYAFIVSEAPRHGMQVFDLARLRNVNNPPETFSADARLTDFGSSHNIVINEDSGYAYVVGARDDSDVLVNDGGPIFINIQNPTNPIVEGGYSENAYSHDAQVVNYNGPDADYTGREIYIGSNANEVVIVDVTDKSNPTEIATIGYRNIGYTHQGWFTEDLRYFLLGDELDERDFGVNSRTVVFDFTDLDNPSFKMNYFGSSAAIDHNGYVNANTFYLANYTAGFREIDISGISSENMTEVGYFDTFPENNNTEFNGVWNVYPYFESGNIIISDIQRGLFIVRASE